jgi:hypothetical protein
MNESDAGNRSASWKQILQQRLPLFGHRNWIVVTDAAYPLQSNSGIETLVSDGNPIEALGVTLDAIAFCKHVRANLYADAELDFVSEKDAPGIAAYREQLRKLLKQQTVSTLPHEEIIARLDRAATLFRILIIKTRMALPYTSIFFELDCGYWNADAEQKLRAAIQATVTS